MKSPPTNVSSASDSPWDRLDRAFRAVLTVPKDAVVKAEAKAKQQRDKKRAKKKAG